MYFAGKRLVIVGPSGAGKTTFMDYMRYEMFHPEEPPRSTVRPRKKKNFKFALGAKGLLVASIKQAVDMPGQPDPGWVAQEALRDRPHALVIVLDATAPIDGPDDQRATGPWLRKFCRAAEQLAREARPRRNRLRTVVVALNKADKVSDDEFREKERRCLELLDENWRASPSGAPDPSLLKCISVIAPDRPDGTRWIDAVLSDIAISLGEKS
jgi:GTPase SAR1 family protein